MIILVLLLNYVNSIDDEIELIRREGIDKFDVSIVIEERVDFLHTRVTLRPLILGLLNFERLVREVEKKDKTELGIVLYNKIENMHHRLSKKLNHSLTLNIIRLEISDQLNLLVI